MYEVSGKSATFQQQSVCASTADGYRAALGVEGEGQRDMWFCVLL